MTISKKTTVRIAALLAFATATTTIAPAALATNAFVSQEDRDAADAQQAEMDARAARPDVQVAPAPVPSVPSKQTPPLVTTQPDGSVGNDKVHILSLSGADCIVVESNGHFGIVDAGDDNDYPDGSDPRYPWRANIATWGQEDQVRPYLDSLGVNSSNLDFFIGTHPHSESQCTLWCSALSDGW